MREQHRLRALQMRIAGNDDVEIARGPRMERALQLGDGATVVRDLVPDPEAHGGGDLVVAAAAGVEFRSGGIATRQLRLDVHVDVLEIGAPLEFARVDERENLVEPLEDVAQFGRLEHADAGEHFRVGLAARDVVPREFAVEGDRFGVVAQPLGRAGLEAAAPG
jgi:hypothetical protein